MRTILLVLVFAALASCRSQPQQPPASPQSLPDFPLDIYRTADPDQTYRVIGDMSRVDVIARRGGKLARFGHDHVVSSEHIQGFVLLDLEVPGNSRADLRIDLDTFEVDRPELRKLYNLDTEPSDSDIEKTSDNMQSRVLQSEAWPQAHLFIEGVGGTAVQFEVRVTLDLHGMSRRFPALVRLDSTSEKILLASGTFSLRPSDYNIEPFSVLGGGLQVQDLVEIHFQLVARKATQADYAP